MRFSALKRYQTFFLALIVGMVAAGFAFNTWVNPWRVTPVPWSSSALEPYREIPTQWSRTAKAGMVRSGSWDAALFGSSRVDIALNPAHPALAGYRCANLGLNAGQLAENHAIFTYFMDRHDPRLIVFCLDAGDLTTPLPKANRTDFAMSPLDPLGSPIERELRYRAGISTFAASFGTLGRAMRKELGEHTPAGFRRNAPFPEDQRRLIGSLYLTTTVLIARNHTEHGAPNKDKLALLQDIIDRCREKDARLVLFYMPNHALFQLAVRELGDPDWLFAGDRKVLAETAARANAAAPTAPPVEVWDFLDGHPLNSQPLPPEDQPDAHLDQWIDLFHATPEIGGLMLDRIQGSGDYGAQLTPESLPARLESVAASLDAYATAHPDDMTFIRRSLEKIQARPSR